MWWIVSTVVVVGSVLTTACSSAADRSQSTTTVNALQKQYPPEIVLFGDSLAWEAQPYYDKLVEVTGQSILGYGSFGGTAICDWFDKMKAVAAKYAPAAVQIEFSGNALSPCMQGYEAGTDAYYAKYRADTEAAIAIFVPTGAHVYLVGAPITRHQQESDPAWNRLNEQYAAIAAADPTHVTYVDAGAAVETPERTYTDTLPCVPVEPCEGPVVDRVASNIVRSPDGTHFCPVATGNEEGVINGCSVYSSGAFRFAYAMFNAVGVPNAPTAGRGLRS